jgi:L-lactate dehydrogenase complex protein LldE
VQVLESLGVQVDFPEQQTCCGQPMADSGCMPEARPLAEKFIDTFAGYDYIVSPSGSCVSMVRNHYDHLVSASDQQATLVAGKLLSWANSWFRCLVLASLSGDVSSSGRPASKLSRSA